MDFYLYNPFDDVSVPEHKGFAYILPLSLKDLHGVAYIPITGLKHEPIGQLTGIIMAGVNNRKRSLTQFCRILEELSIYDAADSLHTVD